jgi:hypothetical protein
LELLVNNLDGLGVGFSYADDVEGNQARESVKLTTDQDLEKIKGLFTCAISWSDFGARCDLENNHSPQFVQRHDLKRKSLLKFYPITANSVTELG